MNCSRGLITTLDVFEPVSGGKYRFAQKDKDGNEYGFHGTLREMSEDLMIQSGMEPGINEGYERLDEILAKMG